MDIERERDRLSGLVEGKEELAHLKVKKWGKSLILYSGEAEDEQKHARLTHVKGTTWGLSFTHHTGRWERTPFTGTLEELWETLVNNFPAFLEHY